MSELRKDPLSGDWIILSINRAKRPANVGEKKTGSHAGAEARLSI